MSKLVSYISNCLSGRAASRHVAGRLAIARWLALAALWSACAGSDSGSDDSALAGDVIPAGAQAPPVAGTGPSPSGAGAMQPPQAVTGGTAATAPSEMAGQVAPTTGGQGAPPPAAGLACTGECWTFMGFDERGGYFNPNETKITAANVMQLTEPWSVDMGGSATGAAAVVDGVVFAPSMGSVKALDVATGAERWSVRQSVSGSISYDAGKLYVQNSAGFVTQIDAATGAGGWSTPIGSFGGFGTPLVVGDKVLVGASSGEENLVAENAKFIGRALALDKATGAVLWEHATATPPANGAAIWSSPAADRELGLAFFTTGNNYTGQAGDQSDSIIALDLETGELQWKFQATQNDVYTTINFGPGPDHDFGANPVLFEGAGGLKLVGAGQKSGVFWALDRMTGQMVWNHRVAGGCGIGGIFNNGAYDGQRIYVTSWPCAGPAVLEALDPATGNALWTKQNTAQSWAPITVAGGVGFVASQETLKAFDTTTGDPLFSFPTGGSIASAPVVVGGRVFFGSGVPPLAGSFGNPLDDTTFHALALP